MAAELAFKKAIDYIEQSGLNFSIYLTPFSAQLSLKKSFANNFHKNVKDAVWTEENIAHKLEDQGKTLENRLQASQSENSKLLDTLKDQEETIDFLKSRCAKMEDNARVEKRKSKKERQKNTKKECEEQNSQENLNVKLEPIDDEDTNEVISEVNTFNKFEALANMSDASEPKNNLDASCAIAERRLINTLSVCANSCIDIIPEDKIDAAVQTVNQSGVFPSQCFYCTKIINSEADIENHRLTCHEGFLSVKCRRCSKEFSNPSDLKSHEVKDHLSTSLQKPGMNQQEQESLQKLCQVMWNRAYQSPRFPCDICQIELESETALELHKMWTCSALTYL